MCGSWGVGALQKELRKAERWGVRGFPANFDGARQDFDLVLVMFSGFWPKPLVETLELGQIKARNSAPKARGNRPEDPVGQ